MDSKNVKENAKDNQHHLMNLVNSNPKTLKTILKHNELFAGVYAISNRNDDVEVIYVGESGQITNRLQHHVSGTNSSVLKQKTGLDFDELKWYKVRYRRMANEKQRKLFEKYAISVLKPKFNL
ncbi:MAG: GIY-YIG nuclease family protein [Nitrosopumilus sp.]|nr:GIY-YIG nuclease family protein [Nitrosopumilus sp.]NRA05665.1 GIY-YIG nuclease family protein [Nitrosopumilus sp.]